MAARDLPFFGRINDSHTHVWLGQQLKNRTARDTAIPPAGEAESLLELMDFHGVACAAIITPTTLGFDSSLTLELSRTYRDRLLPILRIDPYAIDMEVHLMKLLAKGARGFRISTNLSTDGKPLGDPAIKPLARVLSREQVPLLIHCNFDQLHLVRDLAEENPELTILIDHMARAVGEVDVADERFNNLTELADCKNVNLKISSTNHFAKDKIKHSDLIPYVVRLLSAYGEARVLWGSDWPLSEDGLKYPDSFEPLRSMSEEVGNQALQQIFVDNFNSLFRINQGKIREGLKTVGVNEKSS